MAATPGASRTNQVDRLEFMESVLVYEGQISNERLRDQFGIKQVQASRMLAEVRQLHPTTVERGPAGQNGTWVALSKFTPKVFSGDFNRYMQIAGANGAPVEDTRVDFTEVCPLLFRALVSAIRDSAGVEVLYTSMTTPKGAERTLYPHTFVRGGRRWHVRAFDSLRGEYRNFNLGRMTMRGMAPSPEPSLPPDEEWEEQIEVSLCPHPHLPSPQSEVISQELFGGAALLIVPTRRALLPFVLQDMRVATDLNRHQPPEYQLAVWNPNGDAPIGDFGST